MKKFMIAALFMLSMTATNSFACGPEITHNYYLFDVTAGDFKKNRNIVERCDEFWKNYTNGTVSSYQWYQDEIMEFAQKKNDEEMVGYLAELNKYLEISRDLGDTWDYPTKAQLQERQRTLQSMATIAASYRGTRLKAQWALLYMRANMVMKRHQVNVNYWKTTAKNLPPSVYREMMENIYAGALLQTGHRKEAINMFAEQGDFESIKWLLRKQRNLQGIKNMYASDPKSPALVFLVEDFVNNAQETLDDTGEDHVIDTDWIKSINARIIKKSEVEQFKVFAKQVIAEGKNPYPSMWKAAIGELQYLYGNHQEAVKTLTEAMAMAGTDRMADNARYIRLVAGVGANEPSTWLAEEMTWLLAKAQAEGRGRFDVENQYAEVFDRLVYMELIPKFKAANNINMVTGCYAMMNSSKELWHITEEEDENWNAMYSDWSGFSAQLNEMTGNQLVAYAQWMTSSSNDPLETFVKEHSWFDQIYFDDMAGTHYLAEGAFEKAVPLLKNVPLSFMEGQNICYYLANRDYTVARWITKQSFPESVRTDGPHLAKLKQNPKLKFCEEMISLKKKHEKAKGVKKEQLALQLARYYYQASLWGDCWYLAHYGKSLYDEVRSHEMDFAAEARKLLKEGVQSADFKVRQESLYALAFIPKDYEKEMSAYWGIDVNEAWASALEGRYQTDMAALASFVKQNASKTDSYVTKCDILKFYMK